MQEFLHFLRSDCFERSMIFVMLALAMIITACSRADQCHYSPESVGAFTANNCTPEANSTFELGVNAGYYPKNKDFSQGTHWTDMQLGDLATEAGFSTLRPALFASFFAYYGPAVKVAEFDHYKTIGLKDLTLFISGGWDVAGDPKFERDNINFGCPELSKGFKGIYKPIFINNDVNQLNTFAKFVDAAVKTYGDKVKYIEVWNEPDLSTSDLLGQRYDYGGNLQKDSWWNRTAKPCELINLYEPVYYYIRMLRITHEIVRKYNATVPSEKQLLVATGGIGYSSFLKQILEKTDNPSSGSPSKEYPLTGGAYFDVLSYHSYPFFMNYEADLSKGINVVKSVNGQRSYQRHSDHLKDHPVLLLEDFRKVLYDAGYDGKYYPKKYEIVTEIGMHDASWGLGDIDYGSNVALQQNTILKSIVELQKKQVKQIHLYKLGSSVAPQTPLLHDQWNELQGGLWASFGIYDDLTSKAPGQQALTSLGAAVKTFLTELSGYDYSEDWTAKLSLPSTMNGAAFTKGNDRKYILWAVSTQDQSEAASAAYTFPAEVIASNTTLNRIFFDGTTATTANSSSVTFTNANPTILKP